MFNIFKENKKTKLDVFMGVVAAIVAIWKAADTYNLYVEGKNEDDQSI